MDKKSGTPEGGRDERSLVQTIEERIHALLKMAETAKIEPADLLEEVWESEDFQRLSEGAKADLRAKAGVKAMDGEKAESTRKSADIDIGSDSRTSWIAEQVSALVKLYATSGETPDLSVIWNGEDFEKLPEDVRRAAKEWVASKYGIADETVEAAAETPSEKPAAQETPENGRGRKPKRREFVSYRLERDGDALVVAEDYDEWDETTEKYVRRATKTAIALPQAVAESAAADRTAAEKFVAFVNDARRDLDRRGVKLFFDCPPDAPEKICPKWKYFVEGRKKEEPLNVEDLQIPEDVLAAVKADPKNFYHGIKKSYDAWFGPQMQKKREGIISERTAAHFRPKTEDVAKPEAREAEPAPYPPEVVRAGAKRQVEMFARIFRPESAEDHVRYVIDSVRGTLEHPLGGGKRPPVDQDFLWTAVREELFARFGGEGDEASLEAVKRAMPKEEAVRRYVAARVNEALGPKTKGETAGERESITAYLSGKILGEGTHPDAAEKIRASLASYDDAAGTLVIPDPERLRGAIVNLHKHLTKDEGGPEKKDA